MDGNIGIEVCIGSDNVAENVGEGDYCGMEALVLEGIGLD